VEALRGVDIILRRGGVTGLVGESGCGKSTLARILCGFEQPDDGSVALEPAVPAKSFRKNVQMIFQDASGALDPKETVAQALKEPLRNFERPPRGAFARRMAELLSAVGLGAELLSRYPHQLSGGQRQRVIIARALAAKPQYLICDEPVSSLDPDIREQILSLLKSLCKGKNMGCLFISHDLAAAAEICDRVCVMFAGKIVETLPAGDLSGLAAHPYTRSLFVYAFELERCCCTDTVPTLFDVASAGCAYRLQCPHTESDCAERVPPLAGGGAHQIACFHPAVKGRLHA
jgi:ABC-type dipeptide/oligopeptide/nickel transport system ATPase subunit